MAHIVVADAEGRRRAGLEIFDKHIGAGNEFFQNFRALRGFEVESDGFFIGVLGQKTRPHPRLGQFGIATAGPRPVANAWELDFDHIRPEEAELIGAVRSGENLGDVNDAVAGQGSKHWVIAFHDRWFHDTD